MTNAKSELCVVGVLLMAAVSGFGAPKRPRTDALQVSVTAATVQVNLINAAGAPPQVVARAQEIAAGVFHVAGVEVLWRGSCHCGSERPPSVECSPSVRIFTVVINLEPARHSSRDALGCALPRAGGGNHAGVFYSRIARLARDPVHGFGASEAQILGHAIAHELGHLLLHSNMHAPDGLMRADWSLQELNAMRHGELGFSRAEASELRRAVFRRQNSDPAPASGRSCVHPAQTSDHDRVRDVYTPGPQIIS